MSQKVNPKSYRLGFLQPWLLNFQYYGKNNNFYYYHVLNLLNFQKLFDKKLSSNISLIISKKIEFKTSNLIINYYLLVYNINFKFNLWNNINQFIKIWNVIYPFYFLNIRFYLTKNIQYFSNNFFKDYINYLFLSLNYSPKKIFNCLIYILKINLNKTKIEFSKFGYKNFNLKGFKIELRGRFDSLKTPMSRNILISIGKVSVLKLNINIDFVNVPIYTKLGICNFKVWLFYYDSCKLN